MAVLTGNKQRPVRLAHGELTTMEQPLAGYTNFGGGNTAHTVFKGALLVSDTDGYFRAVPLSSSTAMASGDIFGGIAAERQDVGAGDAADGSVMATVYRNGQWGFAKGALTQADVGAPAYATDDDTITTTSTDALWVGVIEEVDATYVWVNIEPAFMRANSPT